MTPNDRLLVGLPVCHNFLGKLHFHAPVGALVSLCPFAFLSENQFLSLSLKQSFLFKLQIDWSGFPPMERIIVIIIILFYLSTHGMLVIDSMWSISDMVIGKGYREKYFSIKIGKEVWLSTAIIFLIF